MSERSGQHEQCINGKELQQFLIEQLEVTRERYRPLENKISEVGRAWFNAELKIWGQFNMFIDKLLKESVGKGVIDMNQLKQGLAVQKVKLEDLPLRRVSSLTNQEIMRQIDALEVGEGAVIPEDFMSYRSLSSLISRMRTKKQLKGYDIRVKKDADGRTVLGRYS